MYKQFQLKVGLVLTLIIGVGGCSSQPTGMQPSRSTDKVAAAKAITEKRYAIKQDLGPKQHQDMSNAPDAVPRVEAYSRGGNKSRYEVWGKQYSVMASGHGFRQRGLASWYGQKFHGHLTSNGETYDMYAMSAAHKSLPLPTFARITNLANNKMVIVRVNDRGPFHGDRVIDLSYAAASKLDYRKTGVAEVLIEVIDASQWSPALEQQIRAQRQGNAFAQSQSQSQPAVKLVKKMPAKVVVTNKKSTVQAPQIRQQSKRQTGYYVQVAAVSRISGGMLLRNTLVQSLRRANVFVEQANDRPDLYRVLIGPLDSAGSAKLVMQQVAEQGHGQGVMIKP